MGVLTVFLDKITHLADEDTIGKADPYVCFEVEQDNWGPLDKTHGKKKSTKKRGDLNPVYGETFEFEVPSLKNMVLKIKVMDDDPGFDDKMGSCNIKLDDLGLSETPTGTDRVVDNNILRKDARIYLQISYKE